ncbi:hypothetical protein [Pseudomonas akapageensis]|nr:hypothetical protein [Pseudomonas akapageensis]
MTALTRLEPHPANLSASGTPRQIYDHLLHGNDDAHKQAIDNSCA